MKYIFDIGVSERLDGTLSGHIFLYTFVIKTIDEGGDLVPVFSMLSEIHNANWITFWMKEFLRLGGSIPKEFCVDMSLALLNAGVCAFTEYLELQNYVNAVFKLNFDPTQPKPSVFIRIDIAHLLKCIAKLKLFSDKKPKVRQTFMRCIGLLLKETDIDETRKIILHIFIMAYSATEGNFVVYVHDWFKLLIIHFVFLIYRRFRIQWLERTM